ncbi:protein FAM161A [Anolis carolinensis]|uniref:Protein FAM161A n=1 Tax=Anolis carolinensis TaxID=28377 RepID=G1KE87_ANOCA|nr:PREDICTED: protein FAM161A isoform X1 [Anolis carolinensis]|eukprot:XP_008112596.1 PREDICTED: protein FAM161A isoform X1 [Anolis carolinensis]
MDASHRAASLAVSCLRRPVDPRTRAPIALYEREREDGAWQQNNLHPEREQSSDVHADCKDWADISKMYLSNQEYYLKLEELKNAHQETMAKLENMYQNKLYLKGVEPLTNTDMANSTSYRSAYGLNSFNPQKRHTSFSEPDLNSYFHSNVSDTSDEELYLDEDDSEEELLTFQKQQIESACDRFSPEDYSHRTKSISSMLQTLRKPKKKKKKRWSPKITVPQPFQMTIRESKKKQHNVKSKSLIELENNLLKKRLEEEMECQKKFRANPVPAYVFVPLYHEIMQQNEERRKSLRESRREILLGMQKPFKFIEREAQKKELKKVQLKDLSLPEKTRIFKAKPVPKCIYSSEVNEKLKEEELYRQIRIQMRSEELLRNSFFPSNRLGNKGPNKHREQCCLEHNEGLGCKPRHKTQVPDFEILHKKFRKQLQRQKDVKPITVCEPFSLRTANIPSNKKKILEDIQMDEEKLKETRWPYASSRCSPQMRTPLDSEEPISPRITESTRRRLQAIRNSAKEKQRVEEEQKRRRAKQKQRARELQRLISTRAEANDPHQSLAQIYKSKLKIFRKHEKQRMKEYLQELEEMEERVEKRPLLLEQATQKNARIAAEKLYSDTLRELGLCEEFVSKKGQSKAEMLLQGHSRDDSEISAEADIRSDNEDKTQDKESPGAEEKSETESIQSYKEEVEEEEEEEEKEEEEEDDGDGEDSGGGGDDGDDGDGEIQSDHGDQDAPADENENNEEDSGEEPRDYQN